jgi:P4 family phage/plasmid primase-like protien
VPDGGGGMSGQHQEDLNEKARRYREGEQSAPPNGHREPSEKLSPQHRRELEASAIDQAVWEERGYETIQRPDSGDTRPRQRLKSYGIPNWAIKEDWNFPGTHHPHVRADRQGRLLPVEATHPDSAQRKATEVRLTTRHRVPARRSPTVDPATSRDRPGPAHDGHPRPQSGTVDHRRRQESRQPHLTRLLHHRPNRGLQLRAHHGTLGDWEDVYLKGRTVVICYDSDALVKRDVLLAMLRISRWLRSKGVAKVIYLMTPSQFQGVETKGADDYFAAGGTLEQLRAAGTTITPRLQVDNDEFSDNVLAEYISDDLMTDRHVWIKGIGWMIWDGRKWCGCSDESVMEDIRTYCIDQLAQAIEALKADKSLHPVADGWRSMLKRHRTSNVMAVCKGIMERHINDLDSDTDLINTPDGVVDLETGQVIPHSPILMMTKMTRGSYRPGTTHPDWDKALEALPKKERDWYKIRVGQGITGHRTPDGIMPILHGEGENGKSALSTDGLVPALGDYASMASPKLFTAGKGNEHSTERADLRGKRLVIAEELPEGRSIDVAALKQIQDVGRIRAHYMYQDNFEFATSHSLFQTTNYQPVINETDHGTWRRLALLVFPYLFRKPGEDVVGDWEKPGDPTLKQRIELNESGQHDAIVTWQSKAQWPGTRTSTTACRSPTRSQTTLVPGGPPQTASSGFGKRSWCQRFPAASSPLRWWTSSTTGWSGTVTSRGPRRRSPRGSWLIRPPKACMSGRPRPRSWTGYRGGSHSSRTPSGAPPSGQPSSTTSGSEMAPTRRGAQSARPARPPGNFSAESLYREVSKRSCTPCTNLTEPAELDRIEAD